MEAVDGEWSAGRMIIDFSDSKAYIAMRMYTTFSIAAPFHFLHSIFHLLGQDGYQLVTCAMFLIDHATLKR